MGLTGLWIALGVHYIWMVVGWQRFLAQPADGIGGFLEGGFAPLAFLWLVIGFFLQQHGLNENTEAIRLQYEAMQRNAEHAEEQARAIRANEMHARQDTFMEIAEMVRRQLGGIAGMLYMSSQAEVPSGLMEGTLGRMWSQLNLGDPEVFSRALLVLCFSPPEDVSDVSDLFYATPIRTRHCENFIRIFERLLHEAEDCDSSGIIREAVEGSAHGNLYRRMLEYRQQGGDRTPPT
jgi:hypothetical protein